MQWFSRCPSSPWTMGEGPTTSNVHHLSITEEQPVVSSLPYVQSSHESNTNASRHTTEFIVLYITTITWEGVLNFLLLKRSLHQKG